MAQVPSNPIHLGQAKPGAGILLQAPRALACCARQLPRRLWHTHGSGPTKPHLCLTTEYRRAHTNTNTRIKYIKETEHDDIQ